MSLSLKTRLAALGAASVLAVGIPLAASAATFQFELEGEVYELDCAPLDYINPQNNFIFEDVNLWELDYDFAQFLMDGCVQAQAEEAAQPTPTPTPIPTPTPTPTPTPVVKNPMDLSRGTIGTDLSLHYLLEFINHPENYTWHPMGNPVDGIILPTGWTLEEIIALYGDRPNENMMLAPRVVATPTPTPVATPTPTPTATPVVTSTPAPSATPATLGAATIAPVTTTSATTLPRTGMLGLIPAAVAGVSAVGAALVYRRRRG